MPVFQFIPQKSAVALTLKSILLKGLAQLYMILYIPTVLE